MTLRESQTDSHPISQARFVGRIKDSVPRGKNEALKLLLEKSQQLKGTK